MWMRRDTQEALVGCKVDTPARWILKCVDGKWEGQVGICPATPASSSSGLSTASSSASLQVPAPALVPPISTKKSISFQANGTSY